MIHKGSTLPSNLSPPAVPDISLFHGKVIGSSWRVTVFVGVWIAWWSSDLQTCPNSARFVATIPTRCIYLGRFCTLAHPAHQPSSIRQVIPTTTRLYGLLRHRHSNQLTIPPVELQPCTSNPFIPFASHGFIGVDSTTFKVPLPRRPPTSVRGKYPTYLASNWNGRAHSHRIMDRDGQ